MTVRAHDSSTASAARFLSSVSRRPRGEPARESNRRIAEVLDDVILEQLGRFPKRCTELFVDVRDEYGTVDDRRLWSRLASLQQRGLIRRTQHGYVRAQRDRTSNRAA